MTGGTVFIVDDDDAVRDSLALMLGLKGFRTQCFAGGASFLASFDAAAPGCVLLDLRMPGMTGLEVQAELERRGSSLPVIVVTAHGDVSTARDALKAGALDFLEKPVDDALLLEVIEHALTFDARRREVREHADRRLRLAERLTQRERQVMELLADGKQHREIAELLGISPRTVEVYRARMMEKLQARTLADVIRFAIDLRAQRQAPG
jgi:RNA polymerase sigma factor (sigma-70 family)